MNLNKPFKNWEPLCFFYLLFAYIQKLSIGINVDLFNNPKSKEYVL